MEKKECREEGPAAVGQEANLKGSVNCDLPNSRCNANLDGILARKMTIVGLEWTLKGIHGQIYTDEVDWGPRGYIAFCCSVLGECMNRDQEDMTAERDKHRSDAIVYIKDMDVDETNVEKMVKNEEVIAISEVNVIQRNEAGLPRQPCKDQ